MQIYVEKKSEKPKCLENRDRLFISSRTMQIEGVFVCTYKNNARNNAAQKFNETLIKNLLKLLNGLIFD